MKAYQAAFIKQDGALRTMRFVKIQDLPSDFLKEVLKGGSSHNLSENLERVWDLDKKAFRTFNWEKKVGKVTEFETEESVLTNR